MAGDSPDSKIVVITDNKKKYGNILKSKLIQKLSLQ